MHIKYFIKNLIISTNTYQDSLSLNARLQRGFIKELRKGIALRKKITFSKNLKLKEKIKLKEKFNLFKNYKIFKNLFFQRFQTIL